MLSVIETILQLLTMGLEVAPELIALAKEDLNFIKTGTVPTVNQADRDSALNAAHAALQS